MIETKQPLCIRLLAVLDDPGWAGMDPKPHYERWKKPSDLNRADLLREWLQYVLHFMDYKEYLQTTHWQEQRRQARDRAGHACQLCNAFGDVQLDVHHRTYERRGHELPEDLIVLCRECHAHFHGKGA